jgi:hypothetical protein
MSAAKSAGKLLRAAIRQKESLPATLAMFRAHFLRKYK